MKFEKGKIKRNINGFSLVEMIIVLAVFSALAVIITQGLILSLRGAQKGRAIGSVRENLEYTLSVIERQLRNARDLDCVQTLASSGRTLYYTDEYGNNTTFSCVTSGTDSFIASGSAQRRLTNQSVRISNCSSGTVIFSCTEGSGVPDTVQITIRATDSTGVGTAEGSAETFTTQISLRNY